MEFDNYKYMFLKYIYEKLKSGIYKKVLVLATGALMSPTMNNQKFTIPSICHAICLEGVK